jgi:hypothetical protein
MYLIEFNYHNRQKSSIVGCADTVELAWQSVYTHFQSRVLASKESTDKDHYSSLLAKMNHYQSKGSRIRLGVEYELSEYLTVSIKEMKLLTGIVHDNGGTAYLWG